MGRLPPSAGTGPPPTTLIHMFLLWLLAVILVIWGIVLCIQRAWVPGLLLIAIGFCVGPGGVSLLS